MALHSKKLYFHRNGVTESVSLYTSSSDVGSPAMSIRDSAQTVFAGLVADTHISASNLRVRTGGATWAVASEIINTPAWQWATSASGSLSDQGNGVAADSSGNVYVCGVFQGTVTFGASSLTSTGNSEIFIAKANSSGVWQWALKAGGTVLDTGTSIAVDSSGNSYITGYFSGTGTFGGTQLTSPSSNGLFVAKINTSGTWQWAVAATSTSGAQGYGISIDSSSNCYVTGQFAGTGTFGSTQLVSGSGSYDIFVAKLNSSGVWQWAVKAGGTNNDRGCTVAATPAGDCYVAGYFTGVATFGATQLTSYGGNDIFIAKINTSGTWQWATYAGASSADQGLGIAVDPSGNCYATGLFYGTATFGGTQLTATWNDIFVAKLNSSGVWQWAVKAGGANNDQGFSIVADSLGNCYVAGYFTGTADFGSIQLTSLGGTDIFVARIGSSGVWQWAVAASGASSEQALGIAVNPTGGFYITGYVIGTASFGATQVTSGGGGDIFIAKLS